MNNFKKQFKQGDDYCDIRADYRSLISIGKSVEETEDLLLRAYCPKEGDLLFTPTFWLSLGICEWETGRLTPEGGGALLPFAISGDGRAAFGRRAE